MNTMKSQITFSVQEVYSKDGTKITYRVCGSGPGIIVLPGALTTAKDFDGFARELAKDFTVYTMNRRGRGGSGEQGSNYSIDREVEDVAALATKTRAKYLFGHSFGGFLALEFALNRQNILKVITYEPGVSVNHSIPMEWTKDSHRYVEQGRQLDAFLEFIRAMNPPSAKTPRWLLKCMLPLVMKRSEFREKCSLMPTAINEHLEEARLDSTYMRYRNITAETLLIRGEENNITTTAFAAMSRDLPSIHTQTLKDLDHFAPEKKPQILATAVREFAK